MNPAHTTDILTNGKFDFSAKYLAVSHLREIAEKSPRKIHGDAVFGLESLFYNRAVMDETQSYFLFREAAGTLCSLLAQPPHENQARRAHDAFMNLLYRTTGHGNRAAAEALSTLPFSINGTAPKRKMQTNTPAIAWRVFLKLMGISSKEPLESMGRSIVVQTDRKDRLLVVKENKAGEDPKSLLQEAIWLAHLRRNRDILSEKCHIPKPLSVQGAFLFQLEDPPVPGSSGKKHPGKNHAIAYLAHPAYFRYPNHMDPKKQLNPEQFQETMCRNAYLFGRLAGLGIVHSAPVPLFHNRVQGPRRNDQGIYLWERGGRLDQWLRSCHYPNFGCSGLRDFEHLAAVNGPARKLFSPIGAQILSLYLVAGSYFRMKESGRVGFAADGQPVDARALFDKPLLITILEGVFRRYYHGFVGKPFAESLSFDFQGLADRMVDEMGVDQYMEEILRVADQREMTDNGFISFLLQRGIPPSSATRMKRGACDIILYTGPHLGGFNQRISIPELIEAVATMAALCIYGKYREKTLK